MTEQNRVLEANPEDRRALLAQLLKTRAAAGKPFGLVAEADRERLPKDLEDAYPLTVLQRGMVFHSEYEPESGLYHDVFRYRLRGDLDPEALAAAARELASRHPVLRTSFALTVFSEPLQWVHRSARIPLEVHDLRAMEEGERRSALLSWLEAEKRRPFDWSRPPLLRFVVHLLAPGSSQLSLSFHHAILDGWSVATLVTELLRLCASPAGGAVLEPPPEVSFRDYVALEKRAIESQENRRFFIDRLADAPRTRVPRWPSRRRPAASAEAVRTHAVPLPSGTVAGLERLAREAGAPLKTVLLAAHVRVLAAVTGQSDVTTGLVLNGRPEETGGDRVLGLFLNSLPFRASLPDGSWRDLVREVFRLEGELMPRRRFPLAEIQQSLGGEQLFETAFNFMHFHVYRGLRQESASLEVEASEAFEATHFTLLANWSLDPDDGRLGLHLAYAPAELDPEQVRRIGELYASCAARMAAAPGAGRYDSAPLLGEQEAPLLRLWGAAEIEAPPGDALHRQLEAEVRRRPDAVALVCEGASLTYAELNRRANRVAHALRRRGVGPGVLVGLAVERSLDTVAGILGILKAGGAYLPLDPASPRERLAFMVEDAGPAVLLTHGAVASSLPETSAPVLRLDDESIFAAESTEDPDGGAGPESLAYVIYTSGSTGRPKGALVTHANVSRLFASTRERFRFGPEDVWTLFHSYAFDFSVWEMWGALLYGGRLVVVPYWVSRSPAAFLDLLAEQRVTVLNQTPSAFRQLIQADELRGGPPGDLALRLVVFGGEALDFRTLCPWFERHGDQRPLLVNMYGITETTVHVTWRPLSREDADLPESAIGRQLPDLEAHVLSPGFEPVPVATPGELFVGGAGLSRGYLGRPGLTAERFVPNPLAGRGSRLYRTGDLVRWLPSGELEYLGRIDFQVKVRGFRIELGEIEAELHRHPEIREAVVLARRDDPEDTRLVAYVVLRDGAASLEELREHLRARLPDYMVPSAFVRLDTLPLNANGKVDRRALPAPGPERSDLLRPYVEPRTALEREVAEVWAEVLGLDRVGASDNFFELGGQSLMAVQVIARLRERFGVTLSLRTLFDTPALADLARAISLLEDGEPAAAAALPGPPRPAGEDDRGAPFPLSPIQQLYWISHSGLYDLAGCGTNAYFELHFPAVDDGFVGRLEGALDRLIDRHPMLRAVALPDGLQAVLEEVPPYRVEVRDLRGREAARADAEIAAFRDRLRYTPHELERWPLFDIAVHLLDGGEARLHLRFEPLVVDGSSRTILFDELFRLLDDPALELPPLGLTYRDYILSSPAQAGGPASERARAYWLGRLPLLPPAPELPAALDVSPATPARPKNRFLRVLEPEEWTRLQERSARERLTPSTAVFTAFAETLAVWSRRQRYTLSLEGTYRPPVHPEIDRIIGNFNTLMLLGVDGLDGDFPARARRLQEQARDGLDHQDVTGQEVIRELNRLRTRSSRLSVPVVFNSLIEYNRGNDPALRASQMKLGARYVDAGLYASALLMLFTVDQFFDGSLQARCQSVEEVFPEGVLSDFMDAFARRLRGLAREDAPWRWTWPETARSLVPAAHLEQRATAPEALPPLAGSLAELLARRAAERPDAPAVLAGGRSLSRGELHERAGLLARRLREAGVRPGARVAVVAGGPDRVVALLGALQAGAVSVPLPPGAGAASLERWAAALGIGWIVADTRGELLQERLGRAAVLFLDEEPAGLAALPLVERGPDDPAFLLPAGDGAAHGAVALRHGTVGGTLLDLAARLELGPRDRVLSLWPAGSDLALLATLAALASGAALVLPEEGGAGAWTDAVARFEATVWTSPPALLGSLLDAAEEGGPGERLRSLRLAVAARDRAGAPLARRLRRHAPGARLVVLRGGPETTLASALAPVPEEALGRETWGSPLAGRVFHVLNEALEPCPDWVAGELYAAGPGLAEAVSGGSGFHVHPQTGERLYRTGERARALPSGEIERLGREGESVEILGYPVELHRLERRLESHPGVRAAAVVAVPWRGSLRLAAFAAAAAGLEAGLFALLAADPAYYKVPGRVFCLPDLPLTGSGLVDRERLAALGREELARAAAATPIDPDLRRIWEEVLGRPAGADESFFDLGGTSFLLVRLQKRVEERYGARPPLVELFLEPTLAGLGRLLERQGEREPPALILNHGMETKGDVT